MIPWSPSSEQPKSWVQSERKFESRESQTAPYPDELECVDFYLKALGGRFHSEDNENHQTKPTPGLSTPGLSIPPALDESEKSGK